MCLKFMVEMTKKFISLFVILYLSSCATPTPDALTTELAENPSPSVVQKNHAQFAQQFIRWGGEVVGVFNGEQVTELEIISRPLNRKGEPQSDKLTLGRFIAQIDGFLEPEEFKDYKLVTVTGVVKGLKIKKIDNFDYGYPVVLVEQYFRWKPRANVYPGYYPYYRDPFWGPPWYGHRRYYPYW
jgi:outer membrane lipoprotein